MTIFWVVVAIVFGILIFAAGWNAGGEEARLEKCDVCRKRRELPPELRAAVDAREKEQNRRITAYVKAGIDLGDAQRRVYQEMRKESDEALKAMEDVA